MTSPQDHDERILKGGGAAAVIVGQKALIAAVFTERVRTMLTPDARQSAPMTIDTLSEFLTEIAAALSAGFGRQLQTDTAVQHGVIRAKLSNYALTHLVREYQILRELLTEMLVGQPVPPSAAEWQILHRCIDVAIADAVVAAEKRVQVAVHNFGEPVPPERREQLFKAYKRGIAAEKSGRPGWGLGLVLVHAIAEAHGGVVLLESEAERGTVFTLDLLQDARDLH